MTALSDARPGTDLTVKLSISVVAALSLQFFSGSALPLVLGAVAGSIELGPNGLGLLGSCELAAIAVAALGLTPVVARASRVAFALAGALISAVGHAGTALADDFGELAVARVVAGLGIGMALAAAQAAIAAVSQPDRLLAIFFSVSTIGAAILLATLPYATDAAGHAGGYAVLAGLSLLCAPLVFWLPRAPQVDTSDRMRLADAPSRSLALPALAAVVFIGACDLGLWSFLELIGKEAGLSTLGIGRALAAATISTAVTSAFVAWLGLRVGRILPMAIAILAMMLAAISLGYVTSPAGFTLLMIIWGGTIFLSLTYVMGALAALDPLGRWSAAAGAARTIGGAFGPAGTGLAVAQFHFGGLGWLVASWCLLAFLLSLPLLRRHNR